MQLVHKNNYSLYQPISTMI